MVRMAIFEYRRLSCSTMTISGLNSEARQVCMVLGGDPELILLAFMSIVRLPDAKSNEKHILVILIRGTNEPDQRMAATAPIVRAEAASADQIRRLRADRSAKR